MSPKFARVTKSWICKKMVKLSKSLDWNQVLANWPAQIVVLRNAVVMMCIR